MNENIIFALDTFTYIAIKHLKHYLKLQLQRIKIHGI